MLAPVLTATLALPLAVVSRKSNSLYGAALAILGLMIVMSPMDAETLSMLRTLYPEVAAFVVACWLFWMLGNKATKKKEERDTPTKT
mgnify:FL=1